MERFNKTLYTGTFLIFLNLILVMILSFLTCSSALADESGFKNVSMKEFTSPKYNEKTHKLEYILTGKDANTIGAFIKINDANIKIIGKDGETITSVITTPEAFFNRATQIIKGDKPIRYQSLTATIDGIGFDCNMKTQLFHVRKNVKVLITSENSLQDQNSASSIQPSNNKKIQAETKEAKVKNNDDNDKTVKKIINNSVSTADISKN